MADKLSELTALNRFQVNPDPWVRNYMESHIQFTGGSPPTGSFTLPVGIRNAGVFNRTNAYLALSMGTLPASPTRGFTIVLNMADTYFGSPYVGGTLPITVQYAMVTTSAMANDYAPIGLYTGGALLISAQV